MAPTGGTRLGPYDIVALLGAGGMGEVYRARDPRLGRDVAIKVLPAGLASDPERLQRFEQEARAAAALNHPNILAVYDIGQHNGSPYIVSELLEGETLRERVNAGALPVRKAVEYAVQVARGLAAAHEKGITHRDLKPENLFVTADGRVKILDFGLAKLTQAEPGAAAMSALPTTPPNTLPGVVLGTIGYMSPEQVRGLSVDHRSDIFALGAVIYEMLTGRPAFQRDTAADTMSAILKEDPRESSGTERPLLSALDRIVRYCLEKNPDERFQSARDVGLALEAFSGSSTAAENVASPEGSPRFRLRLAVATVAMAIGLALASGWWLRGAAQPATDADAVTMPTFQRLTFRRGFIWDARFAPDGETVVYSAQWEGGPPEVYITSATSPESRPLGLRAHLADISSSGELAVLLNPRSWYNVWYQLGTLAHLPLTGGAPREVADAIWYADWSPDGREQAVVRQVGRRWRLEYPIGRILQESSDWIVGPRISPLGDLVAFFEGSGFGNYAVNVVDRAGGKRSLSPGWVDWWFLAWAPGGQEVWFGASESGRSSPLFAVDLTGRQRLVLRVPGTVEIHDVSPAGRILLSQVRPRFVALGLPPGETQERGFSWHDHSRVTDLSSDGRTLVFMEVGEAGGRTGVIYVRPTDGSSAVRLGEGQWGALSPDGRWVAAVHGLNAVSLLPTRAGEPRELSLSQFERITRVTWFPDGRRLLIAAREPGRDVRLYIHPIDGGDPEPLGPEGFAIGEVGRPLSPDGDLAAVIASDGRVHLITTNEGEPRPAAGVEAGELPTGWSADGRSMYVFRRAELPAKIYRVEIATGRRTLWKELTPGDAAGVAGIQDVVVTPDGQSYFYDYHQALCEFYLVDGVK